MNKPNDRAIRAIVAAGSLILVIVIGKPIVDEYQQLRKDQLALTELEVELETLRTRDVRLKRIESTLQQEHARLLRRSTTADKVQSVRDAVIGIVRESQATLRTLEIEDGEKRRWAIQDDDPTSRRTPSFDMESDFELHSHTVTLVADGSLESVLAITEKTKDQGWLMTVESLGLKPVGADKKTIGLELRIVLYGMERSEREVDDFIASGFETNLK